MARIPNEEIDRLKRETDLLALARSRGIALVKHGTKDWVGRCPFHGDSEASPNLIFSPAKGLFHCMACGVAGNAIQFVERFDGISFRHAYELLANGSAFEQAPAHVLKAGTVRKLDCPLDAEASDAELMAQVMAYYHERLFAPENRHARNMLEARGLWDEEAVKRFRIGYADRTLGLRLPPKNRRDGAALRERLTALGLYRESGHEHFNGSIVVPIEDAAGNVVEVYGRKVRNDLRKGTPSHLYLPGPHAGVWNQVELGREVILCEAPLDALSFYVHGQRNVTFIYGTQGFTDELMATLTARKVERVWLAYDADEAGNRAAERDAERLMAEGMEVLRVRFPWGLDANQLAKEQGGEALRQSVRSAEWLGGRPVSSVAPVAATIPLVRTSLAAEELAAKKEEALSMAAPALVETGAFVEFAPGGRTYRVGGLEKNHGTDVLKITLRVMEPGGLFHLDTLDLYRDQERRRFIDRAAEDTLLSKELLKRDLGKLLLALESHRDARLAALEAPEETTPAMSPEEREAALELLRAPDLLGRIGAAFDAAGVVGETTNKLAGYLVCTSRLLAKPLAAIIQSTSAAGKSTLMEAVLSFFPGEDQVKYSAMTGQSLYYLGEKNLSHKILAIVEEEGAEKASYALKLLQSEGELTIASTGKDPQSGRMETQEYHVEGPVSILFTTTAIDIDEELMNRCLILTVDESREQTERIHELQREARTLEGLRRRKRREAILTLLRNVQRLLEPVAIVNPYAPHLRFTAGRTRTRRDHEKYLTLIETLTLLHQHQRPLEHDAEAGPHLKTTLADIEAANRLAPEILGRSLDELPPQTRLLLEAIKAHVRGQMEAQGLMQRQCRFTRREIREATGWSETQTRLHLQRLEELEYLRTTGGRNGVAMNYELLIDAQQPGELAAVGLIDVAELRHLYDRRPRGKKGDLAPPSRGGPGEVESLEGQSSKDDLAALPDRASGTAPVAVAS
jgi:DNA primase catalytic core